MTNDDGIHSPGLRALVEALHEDFDVLVVAPEREQSAAGHSITLHKPLRMEKAAVGRLDVEAYCTNGTPADCIILGLLGEFERPEMVISGINSGANLGEEVFYSGTVSAAMEASIQGLPAAAISVSQPEGDDTRFKAAAAFARALAHALPDLGLPSGTFLNVNVPAGDVSAVQGLAITRLGRRSYANRLEKRTDPRGRPYYWFSGEPEEIDSGPETDIGALREGKISVTPLQIDLTDYRFLEPLSARAEELWHKLAALAGEASE